MKVTFTNLTITFEAESPEDAYRWLEAGMANFTLAVGEVAWESGSYYTDEDEEERDTIELID